MNHLGWIILALALSTGRSFTNTGGSNVALTTVRTALQKRVFGEEIPTYRSTRTCRALPRPQSFLQAHSIESTRSSRKQGWPRRIWSKIVTRQTNKELQMQVVMDQETEELLESVTAHYHDEYASNDFIRTNLVEIAPSSVLPKAEDASLIDAEFYNVNIIKKSSPEEKQTPVVDPSTKTNKAIFVSRWLGNIFEIIITGIIQRNAKQAPEGLNIRVQPTGNVMAALLRGRFRTDAEVLVDRLVFPAIRMSGGRLEIKRLTLQLLGFLGEEGTRFPKQFDLHAHDWIFSKDDLLESPCIRNGLRRLLVRILRDRGVQSSTIQVTSLDILPSGKISIKGAAKTLFDSSLNFEVRTGVDFTTRGHVLTFPGLEVSINSPLFVPVVPTIDIDVGHNARFRDIFIDGRAKLVRLSASVTITPERTIRLLTDYQQSSEAFSARFSVDVGQWLTNIGNFRR